MSRRRKDDPAPRWANCPNPNCDNRAGDRYAGPCPRCGTPYGIKDGAA